MMTTPSRPTVGTPSAAMEAVRPSGRDQGLCSCNDFMSSVALRGTAEEYHV